MMRQRQNRQQAEQLSERYHQAYVDAYIAQRHYPDQTIEEWTSAEGASNFGASQIYKPLSVNVSISGPSDNLFAVDCTKMDWHPRLVTAVKGALVEARRIPSDASVSLSDVTGKPISSEMSAAALQTAGVIYPVVNGARITRSPMIGQEMQVGTPVSHQANKDGILTSWAQTVASKAVSVIAAAANGASDAANVDQRLFGQSTASQLSQLVQKEIAPVAELFVEPGTPIEQIAQVISEKIMGAVEKAYQQRASDVVAFFKHQQAIASSPVTSKQTSERSIFSASAKAAKEQTEMQLVQGAISRKIDILYPTQLSLHKDILAPIAASENEELHAAIGHCLCAPQNGKRHRSNGGGMERRRKQVTVLVGAEVDAAAAAAHQKTAAADHLASFREMLGDEQYIRAIAARNSLAGVPPSPGFAPIEGKHKKEKKDKKNKKSAMKDSAYDRPSLMERVMQKEKKIGVEATPAAVASSKTRQMPGLEAVSSVIVPGTTAAAAVGRQMPGLESAPVAVASVPVARQMPGLETTASRGSEYKPVAIARQMPGLETVATASAPIARQMPGLETSASVSANATVQPQPQGRIKHLQSSKQLPQINN